MEEGDGPAVAAHVRRTDENGLEAVAREGQGGAKPGCPCADDRDLAMVFRHVLALLRGPQ
jgi:hypothetical protein